MNDDQPIDVFVSYSSFDRERVRPIVEELTTSGMNVWWDSRIAPGAGFDSEIQNALDKARCVLVVWSEHSVTSEWVITEASEGAERGILVPVSIDDSRPPLAFRRRQTIAIGRGKAALDQVSSAVRNVLDGTSVEIGRATPRRTGSKALWGIVGLLAGAIAGVFGAHLLTVSRSAEIALSPETIVRAPFPLEGWEDHWVDATFMPSLTSVLQAAKLLEDSSGSYHVLMRN